MIIIPPESVKKIIDATAEYVKKNGWDVEEILWEKYKDDKWYEFLNINSPFYGYYESLL